MKISQFCKNVERVRNAYMKAQSMEDKLFDELRASFSEVDLEEIESGACNAENVKDAIICYLHYGEYDPEKIWYEIMENILRF